MIRSFENIHTVHFIGVGGIGISAIARMMLLDGKEVSGSDMVESVVTEGLRKLGARIAIGHAAENIPEGADLVIYTIAVPENNPERAAARERGLHELSYPQALGIVSREKYTVAISGTHGKTTTTAMIGKIMTDAGFDPTVIVGSFFLDTESNLAVGSSKYLVVEACEYRRSFLNIEPSVAVITNIEDDHLDYYKDIDDIVSAFGEFASKVPETGAVVCDTADSNVSKAVKGTLGRVCDYARLSAPTLLVYGDHNIKNAQAAIAAAVAVGIDESSARKSLETFAGTWRRFEYKGRTYEGAAVYDDYAHHPTEVKATLAATKEAFPGARIIAVFQPHLFSRTKEHREGFRQALSIADRVILAPIYAAREPFDPSISSEIIAAEMPAGKAVALASFDEIARCARKEAGEGDVIIVMGAGDITTVGEKLVVPALSEAAIGFDKML